MFGSTSYWHAELDCLKLNAKRFLARKFCSSACFYELPDGEIITVGAKTLPLRGSGVPAYDQRAPRQHHH